MTNQFIDRTILLSSASCCAILCLICTIDRSDVFAESHLAANSGALTDFVCFWASSRVLIDGGNPFSPMEILAVQRSVGLSEATPLLIWHPPWTLSFLLPFGAMPFQISQFCWLLMQIFFILLSAQTLWTIYCRDEAPNAYLPWIAAFTLIPTWLVLIIGQMSPLILLGIVGFLHFQRKNQLYLAGVSTVIMSVKPHLFYLFWLGLLLWIWQQRDCRVAVGAILTGLIVGIIPLIIDPTIYQQFIDVYRLQGQSTPFNLPAPSLGSLLTLYIPHGNFPIQFLPPVLGSLWFLRHWRNHKEHWNWSEQTPLMILVSLTLSAYAWTYDQVILLPAVIHGFVMVKRDGDSWYKSAPGLLYIAANGCYFVGKLLVTKDSYYFWLAPVFLLIYLGVDTVSRSKDSATPSQIV